MPTAANWPSRRWATMAGRQLSALSGQGRNRHKAAGQSFLMYFEAHYSGYFFSCLFNDRIRRGLITLDRRHTNYFEGAAIWNGLKNGSPLTSRYGRSFFGDTLPGLFSL
jgi:hypothetical protein